MIDMAGIDRAVQVDQFQEGTLKMPYIEVGALIRNDFKKLLLQAEGYGAVVTYEETKFFLSSVYHRVRITGPAWLLRQVAATINAYSEE